MEPVLPAHDDRAPSSGISRRTIMKGAAWSVPVIAFAAPAHASTVSPDYYQLVGLGSFTGTRCNGEISGPSFCVYQQGDHVPSSPMKVKITLPTGLVFADGGANPRILDTGGDGCVAVPAFRATGAAGNYAITAELLDSSGSPVSPADTAQVTGQITAAPGTVSEFRAFREYSQQDPQTYVRTTSLTANQGGIDGNNVGNSLAAVIATDGTVRYWYGNTSWQNSTPPTTYDLGGVSDATLVDTFTLDGGTGREGGVTTDGTNVWQWWADTGSTSPTLHAITGITGTVRQVQAHAAYCYVRTDDGVWSWTTDTTGNGSIAATELTSAGQIPIAMSSYYDAANGNTGVAVILGASSSATSGQLALSTGSSAVSALSGISAVREVAATSAGLAAIDTAGDLYTYAGYVSSGGISPKRWTRRADNVSTVSAWGYRAYFGGLYVRQGTVTQMFGYGSYTEKHPTGIGGAVTKTFSSDGTYLVLTSAGKVFYWYGNNDNYTGNPAASEFTSVGTVVDLNVWGYHNEDYYGGGYVIAGETC